MVRNIAYSGIRKTNKCLKMSFNKNRKIHISNINRNTATCNTKLKRKRQPNRIRLKNKNISVLRDIKRQKVSRTNPSFRKDFTD